MSWDYYFDDYFDEGLKMKMVVVVGGLTCVEEYDDGRRRYQLVGDCLSHLGYIRIYRLYGHFHSQHHHFHSLTKR